MGLSYRVDNILANNNRKEKERESEHKHKQRHEVSKMSELEDDQNRHQLTGWRLPPSPIRSWPTRAAIS